MKNPLGLSSIITVLLLMFTLACSQKPAQQPAAKPSDTSLDSGEEESSKKSKKRSSADADKEDQDEDEDEDRDEDEDEEDEEETPGICFYEEVDYEGEEVCWSKEKDLDELAFSPASIKVTGKWSATIWDDVELEGESLDVTESIADLDDEDFAGIAQSASIIKE